MIHVCFGAFAKLGRDDNIINVDAVVTDGLIQDKAESYNSVQSVLKALIL